MGPFAEWNFKKGLRKGRQEGRQEGKKMLLEKLIAQGIVRPDLLSLIEASKKKSLESETISIKKTEECL
jgi:predicted transposase YdaD